jgi:putative transposase
MHGIRIVVSDDHAGLKAAREARMPGVPWQRCQFHLQQNAPQYVPRVHMRSEVAADLRAIFNAPSRSEAERPLGLAVKKYADKAPHLSKWMETNVPEGLTKHI